MHASAVKALLKEHIPDSEIIIEGEGCDFRLTIISDQFQGALPVKRQQMIYHYLQPFIASGQIHAVTMNTYTHTEWQQQGSGDL